MSVIRAREEHIRLLARLMRAEAEGEGEAGMLMVGNVGVNRVRGNCLDFVGIRTIPQMVYQRPGGFEAVQRPYFYQNPRQAEIRLARRAVTGEKRWPASTALWFFRPDGACPPTWYDQRNTGKYKAHCFFAPTYEDCPAVYR